jgi:hypothetical protein
MLDCDALYLIECNLVAGAIVKLCGARAFVRGHRLSVFKRAAGFQGTQYAGRPERVAYARVSSKEQEKEGFSIPAQLKLLKEYAAAQDMTIAQEYVDVATAKQTGRAAFGEMVAHLKGHPAIRVLLVEKTDRLYRNPKDWVMSKSICPRKARCCRGSRVPRKSSCTASRC